MKKLALVSAALALACTIATPAAAGHYRFGHHGNRWNPVIVPGGYYDRGYYDPNWYDSRPVVVVPTTLPCFPLLPCNSNPAKTRVVYIRGVAWSDCGYGNLVRPGQPCVQASPEPATASEPTTNSSGYIVVTRPADGCIDNTDAKTGKPVYLCPVAAPR